MNLRKQEERGTSIFHAELIVWAVRLPNSLSLSLSTVLTKNEAPKKHRHIFIAGRAKSVPQSASLPTATPSFMKQGEFRTYQFPKGLLCTFKCTWCFCFLSKPLLSFASLSRWWIFMRYFSFLAAIRAQAASVLWSNGIRTKDSVIRSAASADVILVFLIMLSTSPLDQSLRSPTPWTPPCSFSLWKEKPMRIG